MQKNKYEKIVRVLIYICLCLCTFNVSIFSFELLSVQVSLFRLLIVITLLLGLILQIKYLFKVNKIIKYYIVFVFLWLIYALVSVAWINDYFSWIRTVYFLSIFFFSILIFCKYVNNKIYLLNSFICFSVGSIIHIGLGLNEFLFKNYYFIKLEYLDKYILNNWPVSTFTNTNNFAFYLSLSLCVFLFIIKFSNKDWVKILYSIFCVLALFLICTTQSRGVILALIFSSVLVLLNKHALNKKTFNILSLVVVLIGVFSLITILVIGFTNIDYFQSPTNSNSIRLNLLFNSFYFNFKSYFMGVGAGNFEYFISNHSLFNTAGIINSHNWWLEILVEYGIVVFGGYIIFVFKMYKQTQREFNSEYNKYSQYIILLFIGTFVVGCISPSSIMHMEWLWILFALFICLINICDKEDNDEDFINDKKYNISWWCTKSGNTIS